MGVKGILRKSTFWILIGFVLFVWLNNSSFLVDRSDKRLILLAHRGLAQNFNRERVEWDTFSR